DIAAISDQAACSLIKWNGWLAMNTARAKPFGVALRMFARSTPLAMAYLFYSAGRDSQPGLSFALLNSSDPAHQAFVG
ncbi:MAG: hypothetical protein M3Q94_17475, partial [Pseudomonadota bacterium]|nr:hypothetical protein [Pseudomonadota bacterium]